MIIRWCHQKTAQIGRNVTLNKISTSGYWMIQGNSAVKDVISRYVCRKLRENVGKKIRADFPQDRLTETPSFTFIFVRACLIHLKKRKEESP